MKEKIKHAPEPYQIRGFIIQPSYTSANGSGRTCQNVQGWITRCPPAVGSVAFHGNRPWHRSKSEAIEEVEHWFKEAHYGDILTLSHKRRDYLQWLLKVWPDATSAKQALATQIARDMQAEVKRQKEEEERAKMDKLHSASRDLLEACKAVVESMGSAPILETDWKMPGSYKAWKLCVEAIAKAEGK